MSPLLLRWLPFALGVIAGMMGELDTFRSVRWLPFLLAIIAALLALYFFLRPRFTSSRMVCPECGLDSLRCVQWILATVLIDGKRAPDSWSYFLCESCGARFKQHLGKDFTKATDTEWAEDCGTLAGTSAPLSTNWLTVPDEDCGTLAETGAPETISTSSTQKDFIIDRDR
jgi:hypothetical protein